MPTTNLTVVVAAVPALVEALQVTGQFARVVPVASTSGLRDLLASGTLSKGTNDKVFIFADVTPVDTDQTLPFLIQRLVAMGTPVVVIATSPAGRTLVQSCPGAGLLEGPLKVNTVLGALSGHAGLPALQPVQPNTDVALPGMAVTPPAFAAAPAFPAPVVVPDPPTTAPAGRAFTAPSAFHTPTAGNAASPQASPQVDLPSSQEPVALPVPTSFSFPTTAPATATPSPFGTPPTTPSPFGPQPTAQSPFGAPGGAASPFGAAPVTSSPFASPGTLEVPTSPFGQPTSPPAATTTTAPAADTPPFATFGAASPFGTATEVEPAPTPLASPFSAPTPQPSPTPFEGAAGSPFGANPTPTGSFSTQWGAGQAPATPAGHPFGTSSPFGPSASSGAFGVPVPRADAPQMQAAPARKGWAMTITAPKGGTGKSSMSVNLAAYLGLRLRGTGRNVCLIDANVQQADINKYLNEYGPTVEGLLRDPSAIHPDRINDFLVHKPEYNLSVLLGPATPDAANPLYFNGVKYSQILDALRPNFDYIIIDTPVAELYHELFREFALPRVDYIGVVITPNVATLMDADSWLQQVTAPVNAGGMGIDPGKLGIILNRAEDDIGIDEEEVRRELARWRFLAAVPETKEWKRCNNHHELVAPRNYHELNTAFSTVLTAMTGENLITSTALPASSAKARRRWFGGRK